MECAHIPWHFTTALDLLDHWQALAAGLVAIVAAVIAVGVPECFARRRAKMEIDALRASLATEFRVTLTRAYGAHTLLGNLAKQTTPITSRQVESLAQMPRPVVYPAAADRIGFLDENAIDVVAFYGLIELLRQKADELQRSRTPDEISSVVIHGLSAGFLDACVKGVEILPRFKTGVRRVDDHDAEVQRLVGESQRAHRLATRQRSKQDPLA